MKYVITGAAGNISKPLSEILLSNGHDVTVIGRNAENLKELTSKGAKAAVGNLEDEKFLRCGCSICNVSTAICSA